VRPRFIVFTEPLGTRFICFLLVKGVWVVLDLYKHTMSSKMCIQCR